MCLVHYFHAPQSILQEERLRGKKVELQVERSCSPKKGRPSPRTPFWLRRAIGQTVQWQELSGAQRHPPPGLVEPREVPSDTRRVVSFRHDQCGKQLSTLNNTINIKFVVPFLRSICICMHVCSSGLQPACCSIELSN